MPVKRTWLAIVVLAVTSLLGDAICRSQADSAGHDKLMQSAGERVHLLPDRIGSWRMAKSEPLTEGVLRMLQCREHESRVYVDDETGESVSFILLAGRAGPLLAHTPEVCYSSVDYDCVEVPHPETIRDTGDSSDVFNQATFRAGNLSGERHRVFYGWRKSQGPWLAPKNPRLTLGGQPMLYKLQLAALAPNESLPDASASDSSASDAARRFLIDLLPVLETTLRTP